MGARLSIFSISTLWVAFASVITAAICHYAKPIGTALGLLDDPAAKDHGVHDRVTPLVGGLAILAPLILGSIISSGLAVMHDLYGPDFFPLWYALGLGVLLLMGALDDRLHLSPKLRLGVMVLTYASIIWVKPFFLIQAINMPILGLVIPLGAWAAPFTIICLVAVTNAINMADGRNGLVMGMCIIWCAALATKGTFSPPTVMLMMLASLGIGIVYNLRGRLFLGDAGTYGLAYCIGVPTIWIHNSHLNALPSPQVATLFLIPVLDMARVIAVRVMRGLSPLAPDRDHLHHRLDRRFGWRRGLPIYLGMVAAPILVGWSSPLAGVFGLLLGFLLYFQVWILTRDHAHVRPVGGALEA